jgi:serine/threonine protein kinase
MGEVYRACDTKLKRKAAIKFLPKAFARDPERMMELVKGDSRKVLLPSS